MKRRSINEIKASNIRAHFPFITYKVTGATWIHQIAKDMFQHYSALGNNRRGLDQALSERGVGPTDDIEYPIKGRENLDKWIAYNKSRMDMSEEAVAKRKEGVELRKKLITDKMDAGLSDQYYRNIMGFHLAFTRKPVEDGRIDLSIGGKKVYVHRELSDNKIMMYGDKTEVSKNVIKEVMDRAMTAKDSKWGETIELENEETGERENHDIRLDLDLRAGRNPVVISDKLKGDEVAVIPGGHLISEDIWETGYANMMETGRSQWKETKKDGTTVELGFSVEVDGYAAYIDCSEGAEEVHSEGKSASSVSMAKWEHLYKKMRNNGTKKYVETLPDGTTVTARLLMKVDEKNASIDKSLAPGTIEKDVETVTQISREKWEEIKEQIAASPDGKCSVPLANGMRVNGTIKTFVDDRVASVSREMDGKGFKEERDYCVISGKRYEEIVKKAKEAGKCIYEEELDNGKKITVKRESELYLKAAGRENEEIELHGSALDDAIVFASKMDTGTREEIIEELMSNTVGQTMLMTERSALRIATYPGRLGVESYRNNQINGMRGLGALLSQLFSTLMHGPYISH